MQSGDLHDGLCHHTGDEPGKEDLGQHGEEMIRDDCAIRNMFQL